MSIAMQYREHFQQVLGTFFQGQTVISSEVGHEYVSFTINAKQAAS